MISSLRNAFARRNGGASTSLIGFGSGVSEPIAVLVASPGLRVKSGPAGPITVFSRRLNSVESAGSEMRLPAFVGVAQFNGDALLQSVRGMGEGAAAAAGDELHAEFLSQV